MESAKATRFVLRPRMRCDVAPRCQYLQKEVAKLNGRLVLVLELCCPLDLALLRSMCLRQVLPDWPGLLRLSFAPMAVAALNVAPAGAATTLCLG